MGPKRFCLRVPCVVCLCDKPARCLCWPSLQASNAKIDALTLVRKHEETHVDFANPHHVELLKRLWRAYLAPHMHAAHRLPWRG